MSRIGKMPIDVPAGVELTIDKNLVKVKGPKGELTQMVDKDLVLKLEDAQLIVERPTEQKRHKAMHGLYRSLINNMVEGVSKGFETKLLLTGVGYRANATGNVLEITVGYSHPVMVGLPPEVKVTTEQVKGQEPTIILQSHDKQLLGQVAAKIRSIRKPEPYKGKGIRYATETLRRKAGKAAASK
jgi:large subunit ribosomal protein L6